jgi:hypothetical protein
MFIFDHFDFVYYFQGLKATFKSGNVQKIEENIVIVLIDNNDIMETVNIISIFYSYLFRFEGIF